MSQYKREVDRLRDHIRTLRLGTGGLVIIALANAWGWSQAPRQLTVHNPPDLRSGSTRLWWEIDPGTVYAFGFYVFQQLNRWPKDGEADYPRNIALLDAYLTPSCKRYLTHDFDERKAANELKGRERAVYEIPGRSLDTRRIHINSRDDWTVDLDLVTDEFYLGEKVKSSMVRYPVHIVRYDADPERNAFGLQLNCYAQTPQRLEWQAGDKEQP